MSDDYGSAFNALLAHKLETLAGFIRELQESITLRQALSAELRSWIEGQHAATKQELLLLYAWHFPSSPAVERRRESLERSLATLLAEERQETVACLRDTEGLRKELRQWQKQHDDLVQRMSLLAGGMHYKQ